MSGRAFFASLISAACVGMAVAWLTAAVWLGQ
jgi:hypothetical protein